MGSFPWGVLMHITEHVVTLVTQERAERDTDKKACVPQEMLLERQLHVQTRMYGPGLTLPSWLPSAEQTRWATFSSSNVPAPVCPLAFAPDAPCS